jgi:hypothetical protein
LSAQCSHQEKQVPHTLYPRSYWLTSQVIHIHLSILALGIHWPTKLIKCLPVLDWWCSILATTAAMTSTRVSVESYASQLSDDTTSTWFAYVTAELWRNYWGSLIWSILWLTSPIAIILLYNHITTIWPRIFLCRHSSRVYWRLLMQLPWLDHHDQAACSSISPSWFAHGLCALCKWYKWV